MTTPHGGPPPWRHNLDLSDPRQAYAAGLVDGYLQRCAEQDAADDAEHRAAVQLVAKHIERVDRRRAAPRTDKEKAA